jgi:hemolysin III
MSAQHLHLPRPRWRGRLHTWAFLAAIPGGIFLLFQADGPLPIIATAVYVVSVLALFGTSASYHTLAQSPRAREIMQRLDHSMIFVLIAGTYTPLTLVALPRAWGIPVLCVVWAGAIVGMVLKLAAFERSGRLGYVLYPVLGWSAVVAMPVMVSHLSPTQLGLVIAGGLLYTIGIPVLVRKRPDPWPATFGYHEVWHSFTVLAGACHFAAIALVVS